MVGEGLAPPEIKCKIRLPPRGGSALAVEELAKVTNYTHSPFVFCYAKSTSLPEGGKGNSAGETLFLP